MLALCKANVLVIEGFLHCQVSPGDHEIIAIAHPTDSFHNFTFIVFDDLDSPELLMPIANLVRRLHDSEAEPGTALTIPREKQNLAI